MNPVPKHPEPLPAAARVSRAVPQFSTRPLRSHVETFSHTPLHGPKLPEPDQTELPIKQNPVALLGPVSINSNRSAAVQFRSAVLQLKVGEPLVPVAALLAEPGDLLKSLALQNLFTSVLQNKAWLNIHVNQSLSRK